MKKGKADDVHSLKEGLAGCEKVFHCAGALTFWKQKRLQEQVNIEGTQNILTACQQTGTSCIVYISAAAVISNGGPIKAIDESAPIPRKPFGDYARTKTIGERIILDANSEHLRTVAVRPPAIWGAGDNHLLPEIVNALRRKQFVWIKKGRYPYDTCHVRNVCEGAILAAENGKGGEAYFLTDSEKITFREFVTQLLRTQNLTPGAFSISRFIAWSSAALLEGCWHLFRLEGRPPITRQLLALIGVPIELVDSNARVKLGYVGRVTRKLGLEELRKLKTST